MKKKSSVSTFSILYSEKNETNLNRFIRTMSFKNDGFKAQYDIVNDHIIVTIIETCVEDLLDEMRNQVSTTTKPIVRMTC